MHIKRHATKELPETDDAVEKWCTEILSAKVVSILARCCMLAVVNFTGFHIGTISILKYKRKDEDVYLA